MLHTHCCSWYSCRCLLCIWCRIPHWILKIRRGKCSRFAYCSPQVRKSLLGIFDIHPQWHRSPLNIDLPNSWCMQHLPLRSCTFPRYNQYTYFHQDLSSQRRKYSLFAHRSLQVRSTLSDMPGRHLMWHQPLLNIDLLHSWCTQHPPSQSCTSLRHTWCTFLRHWGPSTQLARAGSRGGALHGRVGVCGTCITDS